MAERVRGNVLSDAGHASVFLDNAFNGASSETTIIARGVNFLGITTIVEKKWSEGIRAGVKIILNAFSGGGRDKNRAILAAFTADDEFTAFEID